jgi:FkbM family methyltransferase
MIFVSLLWKIRLFLKSMNVLKNWYQYPLSYFGLVQNLCIFKTTKGPKLIIRSSKTSTDIHIFTEIWIEGEYDENGFEIKSDDIVIDIGAHAGFFSLKASQTCTRGKILSFEPFPNNFEILKKNLELNNISNIYPKNIAVSKDVGKCKLYLGHDSTNSIVKQKEHFIEVSTTTLEKIFDDNKLTHCNLLKLDCEGSEYEILFSTNPSIFKKIKKICMEYHVIPESKYTVEELILFLENNNFIVKNKNISQTTGMIFATNMLQ